MQLAVLYSHHSRGNTPLILAKGTLSASVAISTSNSKEWTEHPEDFIKLVVLEPMSCSRNRH